MKEENTDFDHSLCFTFLLDSAFKDLTDLPKDRNLSLFEIP